MRIYKAKIVLITSVLVASLAIIFVPTVHAGIKDGASCKKVKQLIISNGYLYECKKVKNKLVWKKGSKVIVESPSQEASTPTPSISLNPSKQPTTSPSKPVPLLRTSDFTFFSGKLKVTWSGLDSSQQQLTNVRKINVWVFDLQSEQSLAGGVWRVACYIAPTPGAICEISLPPRDHAIRITASFLNGEESNWSTTLRAKAS